MDVLINFDHPRGSVKQVLLDNGEVWNLEGECNRCGDCCKEQKMWIEIYKNKDGTCNQYFEEKVNGKVLGSCKIMWGRPAGCLFYPRDPYEKLSAN